MARAVQIGRCERMAKPVNHRLMASGSLLGRLPCSIKLVEVKTMNNDERLARQAIALENRLFLRWFEVRRNHGCSEYTARLASVRRKALARVFRRQFD